MEDQEKKNLIELKHKVLQQRISETQDTLNLMDKLISCDKDIKSMEIISQQYEKMYQAILQSEEYDKYEEVENTIIAQISKIESKLDRMIYQLSLQYPKYFEAIEQSENYKNFHGLDIELEKLHSLKELFTKCKPYHSQEQQKDLQEKLMDLKFNVLVRRQIEQMVYENHSTKSWLAQYEDTELRYFISRVKKMIMSVKDGHDEILFAYDVREIIKDNILTNHLIFKLLEQDIDENPQKYMALLDAPIFNPHLCNIANDPFGKRKITTRIGGIDIPDVSSTSHVNLSLLIGVLKHVIGNENTTIIECNNIYNRFGFECRPIVVTEGQEIIRKLYEKVKHMIKPKERNVSETNGRKAFVSFWAYDYQFDPKQVPFLTNAQMRKRIDEVVVYTTYTALNSQFSEYLKTQQQEPNLINMEELINRRNKLYKNLQLDENNWKQKPLKNLGRHGELEPAEPPFYLMIRGYKDAEALWKKYESDFEKLGIRINQILKPMKIHTQSGKEAIVFDVNINLDDIAELPIDYKKIITVKQDIETGAFKEGLEH